MARNDTSLAVPAEIVEEPDKQRAIQISPVLNRLLPYWGQPGWLNAARWRYAIRNQPLAMICRDTLIANVISSEWDIRPRDPDNAGSDVKKAISYYKELFETGLDGDFDNHTALIAQDMLDLPFGGAAEIGRVDDAPEGAVLWAEHVDAGTLLPTADDEYPVRQAIADVPTRIVYFPKHAIRRVYMSPRPEIQRKYWGMAPPEKAYLAMEMLYRGDKYYANLLLDTPEAGILDLLDMSKDSAESWLESFRELFFGIDGFKVPVLYEHENKAEWIPLNRPPNDMLYDNVTLRYAAIMAAAYGIRLSDIGLDESTGGGTLAGVIRAERQSRRVGYGTVKTKLENYYNSLLPYEIKFFWSEVDDEAIVAKGKAMVAIGQGLKILKDAGMIDETEGRQQLIAEGLFDIELDPNKEIKQAAPPNPFAGLPGGPGGGPNGQSPSPDQAGQVTGPAGQNERVPVSDGGRGEITKPAGFLNRAREFLTGRSSGTPPERNPALVDSDELLRRMEDIIRPGLMTIVDNASNEPVRLRRLVKAITKVMIPEVEAVAKSLTDQQIASYWLPEMQAMTFDEPSEFDDIAVYRQSREEAEKILNEHMAQDPWWSTLSIIDKAAVIDLFAIAYRNGLANMAEAIVRSLYEEGLYGTPNIVGLSFNLVNPIVIQELEQSAALLVRRVDDGTKYFIRRIIVAGVRQGLSSPRIADALRKGALAEDILRDEGYMDEAIQSIMEGMVEMSKYRTNSIVNTEINRAENAGKLEQMKRSGFKTKSWVHLGPRGVSDKGNAHPCPVCAGNEEMGFVDIDFNYPTVFKEGSQIPPGHPGVCHCSIQFDEQELSDVVSRGKYTPWLGD